jgi:hypothetical protein
MSGYEIEEFADVGNAKGDGFEDLGVFFVLQESVVWDQWGVSREGDRGGTSDSAD